VDIVLIVDDDPALCAVAQRLLRAAGIRSLVATSAHEALELLKTNAANIGVVISDYAMPHMDGAEFLRRVRLGWPHAGRVLLTGNADLEDVSRAVNLGQVARVLLKPYKPAELVAVARELLAVRNLAPTVADLDRFTPREREILTCLARGDTNAEISERLHLTPHSARVSVNRVLAKLGVKDRTKAAVQALAMGLGPRSTSK
jgi:DNA-binding NarL/FixJ family response regulator